MGRERVSAADQPTGVPSDEECVTIGNSIKVRAAAEHLSWHEQGRMIGKALQEVRNCTLEAKNKEIRLLTKERDELKQGLANCDECAAALAKAVSELEAELKSKDADYASTSDFSLRVYIKELEAELKSARALLSKTQKFIGAVASLHQNKNWAGEYWDTTIPESMKAEAYTLFEELRRAAEEAEKEIPSES